MPNTTKDFSACYDTKSRNKCLHSCSDDRIGNQNVQVNNAHPDKKNLADKKECCGSTNSKVGLGNKQRSCKKHSCWGFAVSWSVDTAFRRLQCFNRKSRNVLKHIASYYALKTDSAGHKDSSRQYLDWEREVRKLFLCLKVVHRFNRRPMLETNLDERSFPLCSSEHKHIFISSSAPLLHHTQTKHAQKIHDVTRSYVLPLPDPEQVPYGN